MSPGGQHEKSGAGEGIRTLDPDLGKVVPSRCAALVPFAGKRENTIITVDFGPSFLFSFASICAGLLATC
jgi:hypothetical protein